MVDRGAVPPARGGIRLDPLLPDYIAAAHELGRAAPPVQQHVSVAQTVVFIRALL